MFDEEEEVGRGTVGSQSTNSVSLNNHLFTVILGRPESRRTYMGRVVVACRLETKAGRCPPTSSQACLDQPFASYFEVDLSAE